MSLGNKKKATWQTLPNATPRVGEIQPFIKIAVTCISSLIFSTKQLFSLKKSSSDVLRDGLAPKQPKLVVLGTQNLRLGTKKCPYEVIVHTHLEEKNYKKNLVYKKNQFDQVELEKIKSYNSCS